MKASQVIRSIKTDVNSWSIRYDSDSAMVFTNNKLQGNWNFVRQVGGGYYLKSKKFDVEMNWVEGDMVAEQLFLSLIDLLL